MDIEQVIRAIAREEVEAALRGLTNGQREWLTSVQAADYLGISRGHVHNLVSTGRLPRSGKRGSRLMFRRVDLDAYLGART